MPNRPFTTGKTFKYKKFFNTYEIPFPETRFNDNMPNANQQHRNPSVVCPATSIDDMTPQQGTRPESQKLQPQKGFTRNIRETPSTSIAKQPHQGQGNNPDIRNNRQFFASKNLLEDRSKLQNYENNRPGPYTGTWTTQNNDRFNQQPVEESYQTPQHLQTGTIDQLAQKNSQNNFFRHSSVIHLVNGNHQKMASVLHQMESVNLNNGIYNDYANINNFHQPPNNTQINNNSTNNNITESNLSMETVPFNINKNNYGNKIQEFNKPSNEKLSKQPYQSYQLNMHNIDNRGNGEIYQPRNLCPNHEPLVYEDQMKNISVVRQQQPNSNTNHTMSKIHNQRQMIPQQSFVREEFKNLMTPNKMANTARSSHFQNSEGANGQSTARRSLSMGKETSENSRYPPLSNLFAEPRNRNLSGKEVKIPETNLGNSQFPRENSPELWETNGEPLPEKKLGFKYSKYATVRLEKTSKNSRRINHQLQGKTKLDEETRDLKYQLKTFRKLESRTKRSLELIIRAEKNILEKLSKIN